MDKILVHGRNSHGLFYNSINLKNEKIIDKRIADTWGYILNAYYTTYLVDKKEEYINAVRKPFKFLNLYYRNYSWEPNGEKGALGSHDGYADALESGINLLNRENDSSLITWIDSEIKVMFEMQQKDGIIEGWHGDGNFTRTALMYGLWKTKGARLIPWNKNLRIGAEKIGSKTFFVIKSHDYWKGKLLFDQMRHKTILNLPIDYPRINQFPEWFTIDPNRSYKIRSSNINLNSTYYGKKLIDGIQIDLSPGKELIISIEKTPLL